METGEVKSLVDLVPWCQTDISVCTLLLQVTAEMVLLNFNEFLHRPVATAAAASCH
jgi:hypothetical protein